MSPRRFFLSLHIFAASLSLAWLIQLPANFFYPAWYEILSIDEHIDHFAPKNLYNREGFANTSHAQRLEIFNVISSAVAANDTDRLKQLKFSYQDSTGAVREQFFFRSVEIEHLRLVSTLVRATSLLACVYFVAFAAWAIAVFARKLKVDLPGLFENAVFMVLTVLVPAIAILAFGAKNLFYFLHDIVFPEGHVWFFYYQDSLMSTLMKAPYLFGGIAANILLLALALDYLFLLSIKRFTAGKINPH